MDCGQLKETVIVPTLTDIGLCSDAAVNLLLGTAAQETQLGKYLVQTNMPLYTGGIGIYQMQPATYDFVWFKKIESNIMMKSRVGFGLGMSTKPNVSNLAGNLYLATVMARLFYDNVQEALPAADDLPGLAAYYKKYWNTEAGSATTQEFIDNYNQYIHFTF